MGSKNFSYSLAYYTKQDLELFRNILESIIRSQEELKVDLVELLIETQKYISIK